MIVRDADGLGNYSGPNSYEKLLSQAPNYGSWLGEGRYDYFKWLASLSSQERQTFIDNFNFFKDPRYMKSWTDWYNLYNITNNGADPNSYYSNLGLGGDAASAEKYIDNMIAQGNTEAAREWEEHMRDTDTLSQANQLSAIGLSPSVVSQIGGANHTGVDAAKNVMSNNAQARAMMKYQERYGLARQLIGMTGSMAAAGIYGNAIKAAKRSASVLSSAAAHSGFAVLKHHNGYGSGERYEVDENGLLKI